MKACTKCGETKTFDQFHPRPSAKDGYRSDCKACRRAREAQRYAEDPERFKARASVWVAGNPDKHRAYVRKSNARNGVSAKRRARLRAATVDDFTAEELLASWTERGLEGCTYCPDGEYEHADHVVPLSRGGSHSIDNLVPACARCNLSKGAKLLEEWLPGHQARLAASA